MMSYLLIVALMGLQPVSSKSDLAEAANGPGLNSGERYFTFLSADRQVERFFVQLPEGPLPSARISPKYDFEYKYITPALARTPDSPENYTLRFRVYSQSYKDRGDIAPMVARQLLRQWEMNVERFKVDHSRNSFNQLVDVFLSEGGKSGGEQVFMLDKNNLDSQGNPRKINAIFIFDLKSFTSPLEQAREIAHEYGHATLPAVGGYSRPESWANGEVGERLYLKWFYEESLAGRLKGQDMMYASKPELAQYISQNINPMVSKFATNGPLKMPLKNRDEPGFKAYVGMVIYGESVLPLDRFRRWMVLGQNKAEDWPKLLTEVMDEQKKTVLKIPSYLRGKPIWLPVGKGTIAGIKAISKSPGWVQIKTNSATVTLNNPKASQ